MNQEVLDYIKQNLEKGKTKEQVWEELKQAGWQEDKLKRAFQELGLLAMDKLPGIGDLLERTFQFYKNRFWTLAGIMLPPFLLGWVGMAAWWLFTLTGWLKKITLDNLVLILLLVLFGLIFFVVVMIVALWSQASLLCAIKEKEQDIGIKKAFIEGWRKIIAYWYISVLSSFMVLGGFLLFFIPGIIWAIWFNLSLYVLIAEDKRGVTVLFRSKQLVSGKWWIVFWRQLLITLIVMGAATIVSFIPWGRNLVGLVTAPFIHIFGFLLYKDLNQIKKDLPFEKPKTATKLKFILMAVVGYLLPVAWLVYFFAIKESSWFR